MWAWQAAGSFGCRRESVRVKAAQTAPAARMDTKTIRLLQTQRCKGRRAERSRHQQWQRVRSREDMWADQHWRTRICQLSALIQPSVRVRSVRMWCLCTLLSVHNCSGQHSKEEGFYSWWLSVVTECVRSECSLLICGQLGEHGGGGGGKGGTKAWGKWKAISLDKWLPQETAVCERWYMISAHSSVNMKMHTHALQSDSLERTLQCRQEHMHPVLAILGIEIRKRPSCAGCFVLIPAWFLPQWWC